MAIGNLKDMNWEEIIADSVKGASKKVTIGPKEGWDDHVMRVFKLEAGGNTPKHTHDWPHINYIISGKGTLFLNGKENPIETGSYACVPSNELHQFRNTGDEPLEFICIVPLKGHI